MIARLTGEVVDIALMHIVLDVGGVGYLLSVLNGSDYAIGSRVSLHTHLAVRENALDLYGFEHFEELSMFNELIKIPKIGPKTAMQILSQANIETLKKAALSGDPSYLSKMSGIGKKSAEKIVSGLKEVFDAEEFGGGKTARTADADVMDALLALGYSQRDALVAVQKIPPDVEEVNARVKYALRIVGQ